MECDSRSFPYPIISSFSCFCFTDVFTYLSPPIMHTYARLPEVCIIGSQMGDDVPYGASLKK